MDTTIFKQIFIRDLNRLKDEIGNYQNEAAIWIIDKEIKNSAGNLCLHLIGNLNTYIGAILGKSGYIRHREQEFELKNVPRAELLRMIDDTVLVLQTTFDLIKEEELEENYPTVVFESQTTTGFMLVHLAVHLGYHLGQINYHRRLLDPSTSTLNGQARTNRVVLDELYQFFTEGALHRLRPLFQPDAVWIQMEGFPGGGTFTGRDAIIEGVFGKLKTDWQEWKSNIDSFIEANDGIFVTGHYSGTHSSTGKSFKADFIHEYQFKDGRIARFKQYTDTAQIEKASLR